MERSSKILTVTKRILGDPGAKYYHIARTKPNWFRVNKTPFISPDKRMPLSPDAAPCDYFLWGYLKSQLKKRKVKNN